MRIEGHLPVILTGGQKNEYIKYPCKAIIELNWGMNHSVVRVLKENGDQDGCPIEVWFPKYIIPAGGVKVSDQTWKNISSMYDPPGKPMPQIVGNVRPA